MTHLVSLPRRGPTLSIAAGREPWAEVMSRDVQRLAVDLMSGAGCVGAMSRAHLRRGTWEITIRTDAASASIQEAT